MSTKEAVNPTDDEPRNNDDPAQAASEPEAGAAGPAEATEEGAASSPEELKLMLEDARAKADEHWDALLRTRAELDNLRKRSERDLENAHKFGAEQYIAEILPVWDSMEMGLAAASEEGVDIAKVREGLELTLKMLTGALEKMGVRQVDPQGETFDPERHQAMTMQETDQVEPGKVVTVVQKGYTLHDRLVRPALVIVAKQPQ